MVYLSVGLLVASLSFLIYRHPPASWPPLLGPWRRKADVATGRRGLDEVDEKTELQGNGSRSEKEDITSTIAQPAFSAPSLSKASRSPDSTPKARTLEPQKLSTIPSMSLNGSHSPLTDPSPMPPSPPSQRFSPSLPKHNPTQTNTLQPTPTSMPPPPRPPPKPTRRAPPSPSPTSSLRPPPRPSAASTTRALPTTTSLAPTTSTQPPSQRKSKKVLLAPGHSPLDWALLTKSPTISSSKQLRGANLPPHLIRVPPSLLKAMNGRKGRDAWSVWQGKVYNITPYLPFHPGGEAELMKAAGREARALFMEVHPWVNWEGMLAKCLVGVLVDEGDDKWKGSLDEMD